MTAQSQTIPTDGVGERDHVLIWETMLTTLHPYNHFLHNPLGI